MRLPHLVSFLYAFMAPEEVFGGRFQSTLTDFKIHHFVLKEFPSVFEEGNRRKINLFYMVREIIMIGKAMDWELADKSSDLRSAHFLTLYMSQFSEYWFPNLQNKACNFLITFQG